MWPVLATVDAFIKTDGGVKPRTGNIMLKMDPKGGSWATRANHDYTTIERGSDYEISYWVYAPTAATLTVKAVQNAVNVDPITFTDSIKPAGAWVNVIHRVTPGRNITQLRIDFTDSGGTLYLDDVTLRKVTTTDKHPAEGVYENGDCEDPAQLLAETRAELQHRSAPTVSYEADVLALSRAGLDASYVGLGDRIQLVDTTFTPDLRLEGRVLQLEEDLLDPTATTVTIGNIIERFTHASRGYEQRLDRVIAESGAWSSTSQQLSANAGKWDDVAQTVVDNTNRWSTAADTITANAPAWNAATLAVNTGKTTWDTAAGTLAKKQAGWDAASAGLAANAAAWTSAADTLAARQPAWDATANAVAAKQDAWDNAAGKVAADAAAWDETATTVRRNGDRWDMAADDADTLSAIIRHAGQSVTVAYGPTSITLDDTVAITDRTGTWTFADGTFVKQTTQA